MAGGKSKGRAKKLPPLLPCPCCGGPAEIVNEIGWGSIKCKAVRGQYMLAVGCGVGINISDGIQEAIARWNTRETQPKLFS